MEAAWLGLVRQRAGGRRRRMTAGRGRRRWRALAQSAGGIIEPGFFDEYGDPAPIPDDIDEWRPAVHDPVTPRPGEPPF